jgi:hypothetical protein
LVADILDIVRTADLTVDTSASLTITTKEEYDAALETRFQSKVELTVDQNTAIDTAVKARFDAIVANYPATPALRAEVLSCLNSKKAIIDGILTELNTQVAAALVQYYNAFTAYQLALKAYFDAWVELVKGADEVAIATAQISIHAQRATAAAGDIAFYIQANEQAVRAKTLVVTDAVLAWLTAVNANAADVAAKRDAAEAAVRAVIVAQIDWRRAKDLKAKVEAEIERIKLRLQAAVEDLRNAAEKVWADVRAKVIAAFENSAAVIEAHRQALAEYLSGIRCDTSAATITVVADGTDGAVNIQFRGIKCTDTRPAAEFKEILCASFKAYFLTQGAAATIETYGCVAVTAKKREIGQAQDVGADMTAQNAGTPAPTTSPATSVVACFFVPLVAFFFHF